MFFGLFKSREQRTKEKFIVQLQNDTIQIALMIKAQVQGLMFFDKMSKDAILQDEFFRLYVFGAYDSIALRFGFEIRQKIGPSILEIGVVKIFMTYFKASDAEADRFKQDGFDALCKTPTPEAIIIGGNDGVGFLQGKMPNGLFNHFKSSMTSAKFTPESVAQFQEFCAKDNSE